MLTKFFNFLKYNSQIFQSIKISIQQTYNFHNIITIINFSPPFIMATEDKLLTIHKTISTSIIYSDTTSPYWISDTHLNYMSQHDFITYDFDQDRIDIVQRPLKHQVIAVKYLPLVGHRNVRIVYLYRQNVIKIVQKNNNNKKNQSKTTSCIKYKQPITNNYTNNQNITTKTKQNHQLETQTHIQYGIVILPSLNFSQDYSLKPIKIKQRKILAICDFIYISDGHYAIFTVLFQNMQIGLVYFGILNNVVIVYDMPEYKQYQSQQYCGYQEINNAGQKMLKNTTVLPTKQFNEYMVLYNNAIYLFALCLNAKQLELIYKFQPNFIKLNSISDISNRLKPQHVCLILSLSKTYLLLLNCSILHLYSVQDKYFYPISTYELAKNNIFGEISCFTGNLNSNKILISIKNKKIVYQLKINSINNTIQFINAINIQLNNAYEVSKIVLSDTGRNAAIFTIGQIGHDHDYYLNIKQKDKIKYKTYVQNFFVFKVQLYTELGVPQSSLYIKQTKYKNRNKCVSRLVIPKIYQKLYALTGSQVHTLQSHKISGILYFDVHPYGFYMAVSFSFNIKIYSIEHNSLTLLYSTTFQQLKKVLYSPDGSNIIIFSSKKLKILNAFSFQLEQEIIQKNNSIIDVFFGLKRHSIFILYENGVIIERSFFDFQKLKVYRFYGFGDRKIETLKVDQKNQIIYILLQDGSIILKQFNNLTATQLYLSYEDNQKITQLHIDQRNSLIFIGTQSGTLRIHNISTQKFDITKYSQKQITESKITAITCSFLQNNVYVGNIEGDISMLSYDPFFVQTYLSINTKINKNTTTKVSPYFCFDFQLISGAKFQGNTQQNALQDKLQSIIQKIQNYTTNYRQSLIANFTQEEKLLKNAEGDQCKNVHKQYDIKIKKLKSDLHFAKQKTNKIRKDKIQQYENNLKQLFKIQQDLKKQKIQFQQNSQKIIKAQQAKIKQEQQNISKQLVKKYQDCQLMYKTEIYAQSLGDIEGQCKISQADVLFSLNQNLRKQLIDLKVHSMELNKSNSYLQTAKANILSRKIQEQTLQLRIKNQLQVLRQVNYKQQAKIQNLSNQLKSTQDVIHHIQNKFKNTPNNVISSDKADSDMCSYKIWMKRKVQSEVEQLQEYLIKLNQNFEQKSQQIVDYSIKTKQIQIKRNILIDKLCKKKQFLRSLNYKLVSLQRGGINLQKNFELYRNTNQKNSQAKQYLETTKIKKITSMERLNQKAIYFQHRNVKIHQRKIKNLNTNNAQLLNQYQKLKYENKQLIDKLAECKLEFKKANQINEVCLRNRNCLESSNSERTSLHNIKQTPFLKYVRSRASKTKKSMNLMLQTAVTTPRMNSVMRSAATSRIF